MSAQDRGWGNPDAANFSDKIIKLVVAGTYVYVHKDVYEIFRHLLTELSKKYPIEGSPLDDWGYANRDVRGHPGVKSNHSWGLAVDINATKNPMTTNTLAHHEFYANTIRPILAQYDGLVDWGGDYTTRKDYMHFEFIGTPEQARNLTTKLRTVSKMATLDADDKKYLEALFLKYYRLLTGNTGDTDADTTHASLNDIIRLVKKD